MLGFAQGGTTLYGGIALIAPAQAQTGGGQLVHCRRAAEQNHLHS